MIYQYIACGEAGDIVKGKINAHSEDAITEMLSYAGYRLINLKPFVPFMGMGKLTSQLFPVKPMEIVALFRQMALLLESGINIVTALELLKRHGFKNVKHLAGGIDLYSQTADPSVPRYFK